MRIKLFFLFFILSACFPPLFYAQQQPPVARPQLEMSDYVLLKTDVPPEWEWSAPQAEESTQQTQIVAGGKSENQWLWRMYVGQILRWRNAQMKARGAEGIAVQVSGAIFAKPETARAMWAAIRQNNKSWLIEPSAEHDYANFYLRPTAEKFGDESFQVCEKNVMTNDEERTPHYLFLTKNAIYFVRSVDYYIRQTSEYYTANDAVLRRLAAKLAKAPLPISASGAASTPNEKLAKIFALYFSKIPKGLLTNGWDTNKAWWWDPAKYAPYVCGGYQSSVLELLDKLRFSLDPTERDLVTDFDYGPIQAWNGGHQAVVIYPKGTDWEKTGIVLDPWVEQKPKTYTMSEWKSIFLSGFGPSEVYKERAEPAYPIVGGKYENPFQRPLTGDENRWFSNLPLSQKQALFGGITDIGERHLRIKYEYSRRNLNTRVIADCPLNVYLVDAAGRVSGFPDGRFRTDIPGVTVLRLTKSDGTFWTQLEYPREAVVELKMKGTAAGRATLYNGFNMNDEFPKRSIYQYELQIENEQEFTLDQKQEGAKMIATAPKNTAGQNSKTNTENNQPNTKPAATETDLSSWSGEWNTNDNGYKVYLTQTGDHVTGTYPYDQGRIEGRVVGNKLIGTWSEFPTYLPNRDAGDVEFTMSADGKSFMGRWRYGSTEDWRTNQWNGTRANAPAVKTIPDGVNPAPNHIPEGLFYTDGGRYAMQIRPISGGYFVEAWCGQTPEPTRGNCYNRGNAKLLDDGKTYHYVGQDVEGYCCGNNVESYSEIIDADTIKGFDGGRVWAIGAPTPPPLVINRSSGTLSRRVQSSANSDSTSNTTNLQNLAFNRPVRQSSTSEWSNPNDAQGAVDGVKNGSYGFHTTYERNPWWQVELGEVMKLTEIRIYNRLDCCSERARTIQILLSDDGVNFRRIFANDGTVFGGTDGGFLKISLKEISARFVRLQLNETNYLHLDEVEIY